MGTMTGKPQRTTVERILFNAGAVLGSLCLVLAALALVFGLKPLIFTSGSMGPAIPTGSLALAVPVAAAEIAPGEVVSVVASDGTRITHRVVSADSAAGLVLKGDANAVADLQPFTGATVDKVLFSLPGLGYVLSWLASPWIFLLGGLLCAYLMCAAFFRPSPDAAGKPRAGSGDGAVSGAGKPGTRSRAWLGIGAIVTALAVVVPLGVVNKVETTQAAFKSQASGWSSAAAWIVPPLKGMTCRQDPQNKKLVIFSWTPVAGSPQADRISVTAKKGVGLLTPENSRTVPIAVTASSLSMGPESAEGLIGGLLNLLLTQEFTVTFTAQREFDSVWESVPVEFTGVKYTPGLLGLLGSEMSCPAAPA